MEMGKKEKREYRIEFKIDAARLVEDQGYTLKETAERLGIPLLNLTRCMSQHRKGKLQTGYKQAQPTTAEAELRQLRAESIRLEMEVAILKKASVKSLQQKVVSHYRPSQLSITV